MIIEVLKIFEKKHISEKLYIYIYLSKGKNIIWAIELICGIQIAIEHFPLCAAPAPSWFWLGQNHTLHKSRTWPCVLLSPPRRLFPAPRLSRLSALKALHSTGEKTDRRLDTQTNWQSSTYLRQWLKVIFDIVSMLPFQRGSLKTLYKLFVTVRTGFESQLYLLQLLFGWNVDAFLWNTDTKGTDTQHTCPPPPPA